LVGKIVVALALCTAFALGVFWTNGRDETLFEPNELAFRASIAASNETIPASVLTTPLGTTVCIIPNTGFSPLNLHMFEGGPVVKRIVRGQLIDDWQLKSLYKVVFVDDRGDAGVWNFDERLFEFKAPQGPSSGCYQKEKISFKISKKENGKNYFTSVELIVEN
jgi:hypothetical protein